jgi:drug/metabolite transporter (DMT)-like permease
MNVLNKIKRILVTIFTIIFCGSGLVLVVGPTAIGWHNTPEFFNESMSMIFIGSIAGLLAMSTVHIGLKRIQDARSIQSAIGRSL